MKTVLIVSSALVLLFTGLFLLEERVTAEWSGVQREYRDLLVGLGDDSTAGFSFGLRQIYLPEMKRGPAPSFSTVAKPVSPSEDELLRNPRARSARLRTAVRTDAPAWDQPKMGAAR